MPMLDELASPHALAAAPPPAQQPRGPSFSAWDFARMGGVPPAALQQLLGPAAGLLVHQAQQARHRAVLGNMLSIQVGGLCHRKVQYPVSLAHLPPSQSKT